MRNKKNNLKGKSTLLNHGSTQKESNRAHLTPIYATSTYTFGSFQESVQAFAGDQNSRFVYGRFGTPTIEDVQEKMAALEAFGSEKEAKSLLFASGMGAIFFTLFHNLKAGDNILTHYSLYGGTQELMDKVLPRYDISTQYCDFSDIENVRHHLASNPNIQLIYIETPCNPLLRCVDIQAVVEVAKAFNAIVVCDNTVPTAYLQQPLVLGVDYVVYSTTKFLNGHGSAIGGAMITLKENFDNERLYKLFKLMGANSNSFDAFLLSNGLKTLELRIDRICSNAQAIALFLDKHPNINKVNYNGLPNHPDYEISKKQMKGAGGLMSFEVKGSIKEVETFLNSLNTVTQAVSLGTADTIIAHPASSSHVGIGKTEREKNGIPDNLLRLSVGIENINDILQDIGQALSNID